MQFNKLIFSIILIFITLINISVAIKGSDYDLNLKEGDEYIWKVTQLNPTEAKVLGIDPNVEVGMQKKIKIESIEKKSDEWEIDAKFWSYPTSLDKEGNETI